MCALLLVFTGVAYAQDAASSANLTFQPAVPFHFAAGPPNAPALIVERIKQVAADFPLPGVAALAKSTALRVWPPIQGYSLDMRTLADSGQLKAESSHGLTYLVEDSDHTVALAQIVPDQSGQNSVGMVTFSAGSWMAPELAESIERSASCVEIHQGSFEVRTLSNPSLDFLEAVWLRSEDGHSDFVYPYHLATTSVFKPGTLYPLAEYLKLLQPVAQKRLLEISRMPKGAVGG